jgi:hypothetical protein
MPRSRESQDRQNARSRARRRGISLPPCVGYAKRAVVSEIQRAPQTSRQIHKATGIKLGTVQGTITRLIECGAVQSEHLEHDGLRPGPREKVYSVRVA